MRTAPALLSSNSGAARAAGTETENGHRWEEEAGATENGQQATAEDEAGAPENGQLPPELLSAAVCA